MDGGGGEEGCVEGSGVGQRVVDREMLDGNDGLKRDEGR